VQGVEVAVAPEVLGRVWDAIDRRSGEIMRFASELIQQRPVKPDLKPNAANCI
jgi:hypothetical protein